MNFLVNLSGQALVDPIARDIRFSGQTPVAATERALEAHIFENLQKTLSGVITKPPVVRIHPGYFKDRYSVLPALCLSGYKTWYIEIVVTTKPSISIDQIEFETAGIALHSIDYGQGVHIATWLKSKKMKTQIRHTLQINTLSVDKKTFVDTLDALQTAGELEQPLIANFSAGPEIETMRVISFDHVLSGARYFCDCARAFHKSLADETGRIRNSYAKDSWPHQMASLLSHPVYLPAICHLCIARSVSADEARRRYGASVETHFDSYVDQVIVDMRTDGTTARAEVQQLLGLSRWVREASLYRSIREMFPNHRVLREASPEWLGRLRIDIYVPELKLAIEHQGEQHFRPVSAFGGEQAHQRGIQRDEIKREKCAQNGVELVEVRYDAPISKAALRQRLRRFIKAAQDEGI